MLVTDYHLRSVVNVPSPYMLQDEFWTTLEQKIKVQLPSLILCPLSSFQCTIHLLCRQSKEGDITFVKGLISTKELKMDETNSSGQSLLMLAAMHGQYELVATAINLGADVDKMDTTPPKMTALKYSQQKGFVKYLYIAMDSLSMLIHDTFLQSLSMYRFLDIEELLQMNLLKTELGRRIEVLNVHQVHSTM